MKSAYHYICSWSDKAPMSLKRILNLTDLVRPSIQNFVYRVRTCFKFYAKKVLVWRGSNWQF